MLSNWSAETGFIDDPHKHSVYQPLITQTDGLVWVDWANLAECRKKCETEKVYFPKKIMDISDNRNCIFPLSFMTLKDPKHKEIHDIFFNQPVMDSALLFLLETRVVPFYIHTPTLFTMLMPGKMKDKVISTNVIYTYFCCIKNLMITNDDGESFYSPKKIIDLITETTMAETKTTILQLQQNLCNSGMMQHYFMPDRHYLAPLELAKILVQYTLRIIQIMERQLLRLSTIGFKPQKSENLCSTGQIPFVLTDEQKLEVSAACNKLIRVETAIQNQEKKETTGIMPHKDDIQHTIAHGTSIQYCENILWYTFEQMKEEFEHVTKPE